jgi:hypothetical protein
MPNEGDYVCVRSRDQGVVWGTLSFLSGRHCRLVNARQQFSWRGNATTLFDVVKKGPTATNLRLSETIEEIDMTEVCGVIKVAEAMVEAFKNHPAS